MCGGGGGGGENLSSYFSSSNFVIFAHYDVYVYTVY